MQALNILLRKVLLRNLGEIDIASIDSDNQTARVLAAFVSLHICDLLSDVNLH